MLYSCTHMAAVGVKGLNVHGRNIEMTIVTLGCQAEGDTVRLLVCVMNCYSAATLYSSPIPTRTTWRSVVANSS